MGFALRIVNLEGPSLWIDELITSPMLGSDVQFAGAEPMAAVDAEVAAVVGSDRVWTITINDYFMDPQDRVGAWLDRHCELQEQQWLIPRHAQLRRFDNCRWSS